MIVQYLDDDNGDLMVRDPSGRTLVINAAWWLAKQNPDRDYLYGVPQNSPSLEIPRRLFDEFYSLVEEHNEMFEDHNEMPSNERISRLVKEGSAHEGRLIKYMEFKGANLMRFKGMKQLIN